MWRASFVTILASTFAVSSSAGETAKLSHGARASTAERLFFDWPAGASPAEVGRRLIASYVERALPAGPMHYAEACTWYGALTTARLMGNAALNAALIRRFDPILSPGSPIVPSRDHVDDRVFGIVPLEIYIQSHDPRYLAIGKDLADKQWAATTADGITGEARYWVDDMWMITALQAQGFRATGEARYRDRAAKTMVAYLDRLQQPNGLFFHTARSPQHWARGNGWFAAGMAELLRVLPDDHPLRARIMVGYTRMMAGLLKYQTPAGLWRQLIDHPESWVEASGSAMFTYAFVTGVKNSWLPADRYGAAARKAWLGLVDHIDGQANVTDVCAGTGEAFPTTGSDLHAQVQYYLARPRSAGDFHGQAPVLWSASALLR
jgi:rhamnogalacturonyl hydrolase YesR